jgi:hypothetical protein
MAAMRPAKSRGPRLTRVGPAQRDFERVKPHVGLLFSEQAVSRWQSAADLNAANTSFRTEIAHAILRLVFGSIATDHVVRPRDRAEIEKLLRRQRKVTQLIATACRLYGSRWGSAPRELEKVLFVSIAQQAALEVVAVQIDKFRRGRPGYWAYAKFVRLVGEAYETASNEPAIVKVNNARSADERFSGPFADLLETAREDAAEIWKRASLATRLDGPRGRDARLDYARKEMIKAKRARHRSR